MRFGDVVKIGWSANPTKRRSELQTAIVEDLRIIRLLDGSMADERRIQQDLSHLRIRQELFHFANDLLIKDFGLPDIPVPDVEFSMGAVSVIDTYILVKAAASLTGNEIRVLALLPKYLNCKDFRTVRRDTLASDLNVDGSVISRALVRLCEADYVERSGKGPVTQWRLTLQ